MRSKGSPLPKKERRHFKGLNYFPIDLSYRIKARVHFELNGEPYKLEVYHNADIATRPGYEDYLFIPFTDQTTGNETYEVGRSFDFRVPVSDEVVIDFNLSYNPYC